MPPGLPGFPVRIDIDDGELRKVERRERPVVHHVALECARQARRNVHGNVVGDFYGFFHGAPDGALAGAEVEHAQLGQACLLQHFVANQDFQVQPSVVGLGLLAHGAFFFGRPPIFPHFLKSRALYFFARVCPPLAPAFLRSSMGSLSAAIARVMASSNFPRPPEGFHCSRRPFSSSFRIFAASLFVMTLSSSFAGCFPSAWPRLWPRGADRWFLVSRRN